MEPTNDERAQRCQNALGRYETDDTYEGSLIDFLADARHWCDRRGTSFADYDRQAYDHYCAELSEGGNHEQDNR